MVDVKSVLSRACDGFVFVSICVCCYFERTCHDEALFLSGGILRGDDLLRFLRLTETVNLEQDLRAVGMELNDICVVTVDSNAV